MSWIKFRTQLIRDGRVTLASRKCNVTRNTMLGALVTLWSLADAQCDEHGVMFGWTAEDLNCEIGIDGFCQSLPQCWIDLSGEFVKLPCYQDHNGSTTKKRLLQQKRTSASRKRNAASVTASISISNNNIKEKEKEPERVKAPIVEGCERLRATPEQLQTAKRKVPPALWPTVLQVVDDWLCGATPRAVKAQGSQTHYRHLWAAWALENAQRTITITSAKPGGTSHLSHRPFDKAKPRSQAEIDQAKRNLEQFGATIKEIS